MTDRTPVVMLDPAGGVAGQAPVIGPDGVAAWDDVAGSGGGADGVAIPGLLTSQWYQGTFNSTTTAISTIAAGTLTLHPIAVTGTATFSSIRAEVASGADAAGVIRLGLYASGANGLPGALVHDAGVVTGAAVGFRSTPMVVTVEPGLYWIASLTEGVGATWRAYATGMTLNVLGGSNTRMQVTGVASGSLPASAAASTAVTSGTGGIKVEVQVSAYSVPSHDAAHQAVDVGVTPTGAITATDVQAALVELDTEKAPTIHVHAAADVTYAGSTDLAATNVEAALDELDAEKAATGHTHAAVEMPAPVALGPLPPFSINTNVTNSAAASRALVIAFNTGPAVTVSTAYFRVGAAAGNVDIGIYDSSFNRLASTGGFPCPAVGQASRALTSSIALAANTRYYAAFVNDNNSATFAGYASGASAFQTGHSVFRRAEGAYPLPAALTISGTDDVPRAIAVYFA